MAGRSRTVAEIAASLAARRAAEDARRAAGIAARRRARQRTAARDGRAAAREVVDERRRALNGLTVLVAAGLARLAQLGGPDAAQRAIDLAAWSEAKP